MEKYKIALVTGGSRGLGKDMALSLARRKNDLIITYVSKKEEAESVVNEIVELGQKATALYFDAEDVSQIGAFKKNLLTTLKENWGSEGFDYLIQNAGIGATIPLSNASMKDFDRFSNIHLKTPYFLTQELISLMNNNGAILFVSSGSTRVTIPGYSLYASMKSAVETLSRYVAKEFGIKGIRSNVIAPGAIETDFNNGSNRDDEQKKNFIKANTSLNRTGKPDDIGAVVAFLCSEDAKWINGQRIEISGGWYL